MTFRVAAARCRPLRRTLSARHRRRRRDRVLDTRRPSSISSSPAPRTASSSESCSSTRAAATSSPRWRSATSCANCGSPASSGGSTLSGDPGPYVGECLSACVYAMMGAVRRVAPPGSEVALHRMSIVETEGAGWFGQRTTRSFADPPMVAVLARYARRMGVNPALVRAAESLAARHDACAQPRRNAALVVRGQPVLTRVRRAGRKPVRLAQNRARY